MASIKDLKKDINYLAAEILAQGYLKLALVKEVKEEDLEPVLRSAIEMRNELIARTNHPDGKENRKIVKAYYQSIRKGLMEKSVELLDKIQSL